MANPHRGEVELQAGGVAYTLRFDYNAIAEIEELLDLGINQIAPLVADPKNFRVGTWRVLLWGALRSRHKGISLEGAGEIMGEAGLDVTVEKIGEALTLFFPQAAPENPQTASRSAGQS